ncbi:MAG: pilus assembly protein PilM [Deltaproteobacteria bacterium]|nr:pilus assembly protein PilM [Deltaproteobacteria bacterium]
MAKRIGLDLGSHSIKVVHVNVKGRGPEFEIELFDEEPLPAAIDAEGNPVDLDDRYRVALAALSQRGVLAGENISTALPGDAATVRTLSFPFDDARKIEAVLPGILDDELPLDIDDVVVSSSIIGKNAAGETEVLVAFARQDAVQKQLDLLEEFGVQPRHVNFDALVLADLFSQFIQEDFTQSLAVGPTQTPGGTVIEQGEGGPRSGIAFVDIGEKRTSVCILTEDRMLSAHTLLHGGADATRALARGLNLKAEEAERGKRKEAFIEVLGANAQFPEQRDISDLLKNAYAPIVRRLRQILQGAMSSSKVRVSEVVLIGGGSLIHNLDKHLAETLNVRTRRADAIAKVLAHVIPLHQGGTESALHASTALGLAIAGLKGSSPLTPCIDFRTGPFAWRGELDFLRERITAMSAWAAVFLLALGFVGGVQAWSLGTRLDDINKKQLEVCKQITGQEIESADRCLAIIQEGLQGGELDVIPERSAVDTYLEISRRFPANDPDTRKVIRLDIQDERVTIKGHTTGHDVVEKISTALKDGKCISNVDLGNSKGLKEGVEFNLTLKLDCEGHPGTEMPKPPPEKRSRAKASRTRSVSRDKKEASLPIVRSTSSIGSDDKNQKNGATADDRKTMRREELRKHREDAMERRREGAEARREKMKSRKEAVDADPKEKARSRRDKLKKIREQRSRFRNLRREQGGRLPGILPPEGILKGGLK